MKKEMLINVLQPEECRIAIIEDGVLEELYVERTSHESYVGNIYKGRIVNIEPSIQAAFVDFGVGRNGFLHVSDVEPAYYRHLEQGREGGTRRGRDRHRGGPSRRHLEEETEPAALEELAEPDSATPEPAGTEPEPVVDETATPAAAPAAEPPEGAEQEEATRGRRRGRGRSRRPRRGERAERAEEPRAEGELEGSAAERASPEVAPAEDMSEERHPEARDNGEHEDRPRFMDSAERRTEEGGPGAEPLEPSSTYSDDDLFFPRQAEEPAEAAHQHYPADEPPESEPEPVMPALDEGGRHEPRHYRREERAEAEELTFRREPAEEEGLSFGRSETEEDDGLTLGPDEPDDEGPAPFRDEEFAEEREPEEEDEPRSRGRRPAADFDEDEPMRRRRRDDRRGPRGRRGGGRPGFGRPKPLIQDIFRRGQEVLVQVIKEGIGTKGPTLSTYISIAGRYLVLMPGLNRIGVSRKITDEDQRRRLREILNELQPPKGLGFIIRTAGLDKNKKELQRDLAYLSRLWQVVVKRIRKMKAPAEIYQESDMIIRTIRDTFTSEIDTIWVDEPTAFEHAQEFLQIVMPRYANRIQLYSDPEPMFHRYGIEDEIARIQQRHVPLPHGGSIVIDQTEALVAIDVNSGNFRADNNAEETAYQMNLRAAKEIARQLRLRDLGGVIVNDFIDMREEKHRRGVERAMRDAVRRDRARTKILKISQFGIIEMTRQRIRPSLKRSVYQDCPHCTGTGQVKTTESMSIDVMRLLQLAAHRQGITRVQVRVHEDVANYLQNKKRKEITRLEEQGTIQVAVTGAAGVSPETLDFACYDNNNNEAKLLAAEEIRTRRR
jgi:ribonuclease E